MNETTRCTLQYAIDDMERSLFHDREALAEAEAAVAKFRDRITRNENVLREMKASLDRMQASPRPNDDYFLALLTDPWVGCGDRLKP